MYWSGAALKGMLNQELREKASKLPSKESLTAEQIKTCEKIQALIDAGRVKAAIDEIDQLLAEFAIVKQNRRIKWEK